MLGGVCQSWNMRIVSGHLVQHKRHPWNDKLILQVVGQSVAFKGIASKAMLSGFVP